MNSILTVPCVICSTSEPSLPAPPPAMTFTRAEPSFQLLPTLGTFSFTPWLVRRFFMSLKASWLAELTLQ